METDQLAAAGIEGDEHALLQRIELDKRKMYGIAYAYLRNETFRRRYAADSSGTRSSHMGEESLQYYTIPKADYKQPLTFEVYQYPGYVLEPFQVKIK